jgi:hypothetical protein
VADRVRLRITALEDTLDTAPDSIAAHAPVQALGDDLATDAVTVQDLELALPDAE